jgi:hypothetical protein
MSIRYSRSVLLGIALIASTPLAGAQADPTPDQAITWKDLLSSGAKLSLYGFVRLDAQYDDSRFNDPSIPGYVRSEDPNPPMGVPPDVVAPEDSGEFTLSGRLTRLGLNLDCDRIEGLGDPELDGRVEVDFYNIGLGDSDSRNALRMRLAYLDLDWGGWSLLAGQDWDVISPLYPAVNHDLVMWGAGNLGDRRPQLTAKRVDSLSERTSLVTELGLGLSGAVAGSTVSGGLRSGESASQPMLHGRVGVEGKDSRGQPWQAGIWGHQSQERYDATGAGEQRYDSHSLGIDLRLPLVEDDLWLSGEYWLGKNLDDVRGGIFQGVNPTTGSEIEAKGGFAELGMRANDHLSLYLGYAQDDPDDADLDAFMRSKNTIPYAAARWTFGALRIGLEYLNWTTEYVDLEDGDAHRLVGWIALYF